MKRWVAIAMVSQLVVTTQVRAFDAQPDRVASPFWSAISDPEAQRAQMLLKQAQSEVLAAGGLRIGWAEACRQLTAMAAPLDLPGFARQRARVLSRNLHEAMRSLTHIENALARLNEARELAPTDPDVLLTLGSALQQWERPGALSNCDVQRRDAEAIVVLRRLRELHPNYRPATVAFELAVLYTRQQEFVQAAQYYAEGAPFELDIEQHSIVLSNWAEVTMLGGNLVDAVTLYQRAIATASGGREYLLPLWGLAVALDRLGEREAALEHAARAIQADQGSMEVLRSANVFFEPESEIHYYEALGYEARARVPHANVTDELQQATQSWQSFFATGGGDTPWANSARDNLTRIEAELTRITTKQESDSRGKPSRSSSRRR